MNYVEIYKLQNDGEQKLVVTCRLIGGEVRCEGNQVFIQNLEKKGIRDYSMPEESAFLYPKDGMKFLENLKFAFQSGYLAATDVKESKQE